ncbi:helix-turn-helix transcriptional regulator [Labrenzia sp. PHM005]|uniref:ArsR/SmtB family transcription factor n=1 Tax=Labrenzia sp. PHM005 TaxID=2590016 RepID=UPI0011406727|nr:metalloregulator ArsR/SmtB family transcription factor [Labrenzia sp. PHM005]QDG78081.1 helix-turn-helix transcriptional regulator [Labrenzia sp. PHM005]
MNETDGPLIIADTDLPCLSACEDLAAMFRALGHPARIAILRRLAGEQEACCGQIVDALPLAQSTVSQHLQVLKEAGLLTCDTRGRNCHYHLNWARLQQAEDASAAFWKVLNAAKADGQENPGKAMAGLTDAQDK